MSRINIEDSLYQDPRFYLLVSKFNGNIDQALGSLVRAWSLAQSWYLKSPDKAIPRCEWDKRSIPNEIIEVGLATETDQRINIKGADDQFRWLLQRSKAGRENIKEFNQRPLTTDDDRPTSSSSSSSSSSSISKKKTIDQFGIDRVSFDFEILYEKYPRKIGKKKGISICKAKIRLQEKYDRLDRAVTNYAAYCHDQSLESQFIKQFSTFMNCWEDWVDPIIESNANNGIKTSIDWSTFK